MGGGEGEFSSRRNFFSLSNSLYEFFLGHSMNVLGLSGVQEFFSFNFPLREFFWVLRRLPPPPPPYKFSNGPSLKTVPQGNQFILYPSGCMENRSPQEKENRCRGE